MAILDDIPGLEVAVCIDGKPLEEYDNDEKEEVNPGLQSEVMKYQAARTVTKYIESVSDQEFTIQFKPSPPFKMDYAALAVLIHSDGKLLAKLLIRKSIYPQDFSGSSVTTSFRKVVEGIRVKAPGKTGSELFKKFKFAQIETTSDDCKLADVHEDMKRIDQVGEITVHVYRAGGVTANLTPIANDLDIEAVSEVHEKALKGQAKSHAISFGLGIRVKKECAYRVSHLDGKDYPLAIFRFKYRSREALKSLLVIERTPSPEPAKTPVPEPGLSLDNLNPVQKTRLEQFLRELVNEGPPDRAIKREREEEGGSEGLTKEKKIRATSDY